MLEFLHGYSAQASYAILFAFLLLCGLGFPMAEELVLLAGGVLVASGVLEPLPMLVVTFLGVLIGDLFLFCIGQSLATRLHHSPRLNQRFAHKLNQGRPAFMRYGTMTIFLARFIPGLRAPTFLLAGAMHMTLWRFLWIDGLASCIFVPALCGIGYLFADQIEVIASWCRTFERTIGTLLVLGLLGWLVWRYWHKRKDSATVTPQ